MVAVSGRFYAASMPVQRFTSVLTFLKYATVYMIVLCKMTKQIVMWICQKPLHVMINQSTFLRTGTAIVSKDYYSTFILKRRIIGML